MQVAIALDCDNLGVINTFGIVWRGKREPKETGGATPSSGCNHWTIKSEGLLQRRPRPRTRTQQRPVQPRQHLWARVQVQQGGQDSLQFHLVVHLPGKSVLCWVQHHLRRRMGLHAQSRTNGLGLSPEEN